jgi:hypothetical protein
MGNLESAFSTANSYKITVGTVTIPKLEVVIPDAKAYPVGVVVNKVYPGYNPAASITICATGKNGVAPYTYKWSTGSSQSCITVSPSVKTTYTIEITDAAGTKLVATKTIEAENVAGGKNGKYITICVNGKTGSEIEPQVAKALNNGATLGACESVVLSRAAAIVTQPTPEVREMSIKGSPNPSNTFVNLRLYGMNPNVQVVVRVTNMEGKLVEVRNVLGSQALELGRNYRPGVYFVEALQNGNRTTTKFTKQ